MEIAFFDFDKTITTKDTFMEFLIYSFGKRRVFVSFLTINYFNFSNRYIKESLLRCFFKGWSEEEFQKLASDFALNRLPAIIKRSSIERIIWHKENKHKVVVVTGSLENWIKPWCDNYNLDLIATELEIKNGKVTGKLAGGNCIGEEKVRRIKEKYDLSKFSCKYAYGNSKADRPMLQMADKKYYKYFD